MTMPTKEEGLFCDYAQHGRDCFVKETDLLTSDSPRKILLLLQGTVL